jgi:methylmalonyl-CoA/ethylmalonyl-CoA epimerase
VADYTRLLGAQPSHRERVEDQGVEEVLFGAGRSSIQLLGALRPDTPVGRFLSSRGPGLHHIAYRVHDVEDALAHLREQGAELIDQAPRPGSRNTLIAFVHPRSMGGVLVELVEIRAGAGSRG